MIGLATIVLIRTLFREEGIQTSLTQARIPVLFISRQPPVQDAFCIQLVPVYIIRIDSNIISQGG